MVLLKMFGKGFFRGGQIDGVFTRGICGRLSGRDCRGGFFRVGLERGFLLDCAGFILYGMRTENKNWLDYECS